MKYSEESLKRIKNNVVDKNEEVPTITANAMQSINHQNRSLIENDLIIRKLTDKEVVRLMGFEDKDYQAMREIGMSKSAIYHQMGDSLIPNIVAMILGVMLPCGELGAKQKVETYTDNIVEKNCIKGTHTHTHNRSQKQHGKRLSRC